MLRSAIKTCLFLTIMVILVACSQETELQTPEQVETGKYVDLNYSDFGYSVEMGREINYLVPNNLIIKDIQNDSNKYYTYYPDISGLKDKKVESKLNDAITNLVNETKVQLKPETIVPYRGIKAIVAENAIINNSMISVYASYNYNNIVSLQLRGSGEYSSGKTTWVSITRGLNIDLNSGEHVPLSALFVDGYDYEKAINDAVMKELGKSNGMDLQWGDHGYNLVKPFTGILENQPYVLTDYGLVILFDERDSRFDGAFQTVSIYLDYGIFENNLALDKRYYDESNALYEDETINRVFTAWRKDGNNNYDELYGALPGGNYYININNSTDRLENIFEKMIDEAKNEILAMSFEGTDSFVDAYLSKRRFGSYVVITKNSNIYTEGKGISEETSIVFDKNDQILKLSDLFVSAFDFDSVIKRSIEVACENNHDYDYEKVMSEYGALKFVLDQRGIIIKIPYLHQVDYLNKYVINIPFGEFGIENLVIFDAQ